MCLCHGLFLQKSPILAGHDKLNSFLGVLGNLTGRSLFSGSSQSTRNFHSCCRRILALMVTGVINVSWSNIAEELCRISSLGNVMCSTIIWGAKEMVSEKVCHRSPRTLLIGLLSHLSQVLLPAHCLKPMMVD